MGIGELSGLLALGVVVGFVSGMLGIGGGVLVIPALMTFFRYEQKLANGTSLAMLFPPAGLPAILTYWRNGNVNVWAAVMLAMGFAAGSYFGALLTNSSWISADRLRQFFALFLLYVAGMMLFRNETHVRAALQTLGLVACYGLAYAGLKLVGRRWQRPTAGEIYRGKMAKSAGTKVVDWYEI